MNKPREFGPSALAELKALLGERVSTAAAVREHHGKDESYFPYAPPDAVVFAKTTEEVRDVVNICRRHRVPMI
ncbi:MAG: FAD-binding oxidoreductase, partial [Burkholderiales bacterium]